MGTEINLQFLIILLRYTLSIEGLTAPNVHKSMTESTKQHESNPLKLSKFTWPYMISIEHLLNDTHREICGGILIHPRYVLTSNTCLARQTNSSEGDEDELRNDMEWGQYMAVASGQVNGHNHKRKNSHNTQRNIFAMRLINFWIVYPEFRLNRATNELNADIALAITEYDFPINTHIQSHMLQRSKQYAQQLSSDYKFCRLVHWPQRIVNMTETKTDLSLMVSPGEVVAWKSCGTSTFIDKWSHICVQFSINDMAMTGSALKSSGGPLVCSNLIAATMSPNAHMVENPKNKNVNIVFTLVDDFHSFVLAIINEVDILNVRHSSCNRNAYNLFVIISINFIYIF